MGGPGSGSWCRWNTKPVVDDLRSLDVRRWARESFLNSSYFGWQWSSEDGEKLASIGVRVNTDEIVLLYTQTDHYGEKTDREQRVPLTYTSCHYGNKRVWFRCPGCYGRCAKLHLGSSGFYCRECYKLSYRSQQAGYMDRLISQKHKLGYRIFEGYDGDGWRKKQGMHQKTFDRLYLKYQWLDMAIDEAFVNRFAALTGESWFAK